MPYEAVIFDVFGTLVDYLSDGEHARAFEAMARALGVPTLPFREAWQQCIYGRDTGTYGSVEDDIRHACALLEAYPTQEQVGRALNIRLDIYRRQLAPRDGALPLLTELKQRGLRTAVISNSAGELPLLWPETPFTALIDAPLFSVDVGVLKPDPHIYQVACARLGVAPTRCLYVGDGSSHELTGALEVGMSAVLICVPYEYEQVMQREDARAWQGSVITHLAELFDHFDEQPAQTYEL